MIQLLVQDTPPFSVVPSPLDVIAVVTTAWLAEGNVISNRTRLGRKVRRKVFPTESRRRNACSLWPILDSHQSYRSLLTETRGDKGRLRTAHGDLVVIPAAGKDNPPTTQSWPFAHGRRAMLGCVGPHVSQRISLLRCPVSPTAC